MPDPNDRFEPFTIPEGLHANLAETIAERVQATLADWQFHTYRPMENPPRIIVRDSDGNVTYETLDPPLVVWEPVGPMPTVTRR